MWFALNAGERQREARKCNLNLFSQTSITKATGIFFVV